MIRTLTIMAMLFLQSEEASKRLGSDSGAVIWAMLGYLLLGAVVAAIFLIRNYAFRSNKTARYVITSIESGFAGMMIWFIISGLFEGYITSRVQQGATVFLLSAIAGCLSWGKWHEPRYTGRDEESLNFSPPPLVGE